MDSRFLLSLVVAATIEQTTGEVYADAGFQTSLTKCLDSWEYKFEDKTLEIVSGCVSIEDYPPFPIVGDSSAFEGELLSPSERTTDKTMWCATEERYNAYNEVRRESWGYCYDSSLSSDAILPVESGLYADGGYQAQISECLSTWTFKEKTASGNKETVITGCASFDDVQPYPFFTETEGEIANLYEPLSGNTDKTKWCAVSRDVYNPTPQKDLNNRLNWGYCLSVEGNEPAPATPNPSASPTMFPTDFPTHGEDYYFEYDLPTQAVTSAPTEAEEPKNEEDSTNTVVSEQSSGFFDSIDFGIEIFVAIGLVCLAVLMLAMFIRSRSRRVRSIFGDDDSEVDDDELDIEENRTYR